MAELLMKMRNLNNHNVNKVENNLSSHTEKLKDRNYF